MHTHTHTMVENTSLKICSWQAETLPLSNKKEVDPLFHSKNNLFLYFLLSRIFPWRVKHDPAPGYPGEARKLNLPFVLVSLVIRIKIWR